MLHPASLVKTEFKPEISDSSAGAVYTTVHCMSHTLSCMVQDPVLDRDSRDTRGPYKAVCNQAVRVG